MVLFFDELPWLASQKSGFLQALDYYWNRFWITMPKLKLIACGSAASWMIENILHHKGGFQPGNVPYSLGSLHVRGNKGIFKIPRIYLYGPANQRYLHDYGWYSFLLELFEQTSFCSAKY